MNTVEKIPRVLYSALYYLVFISILLPAIMLILVSFEKYRVPTFPVTYGDFHWYIEGFSDRRFLEGIKGSIIVGLAVSILSPLIGFVSAHTISRRMKKGQLYYSLFLLLPIVFPLIVTGFGFLLFFKGIGLKGGYLAIIIAHTTYCAPFAMAILVNAYKSLDRELELAASNLGANGYFIFFRIILPQMKYPLMASAVVSFLVSWDEFILAWYVGGFSNTLPVVIYNTLATSYTPALNAVGVFSMIISIASLYVVFLLLGLYRKKK